MINVEYSVDILRMDYEVFCQTIQNEYNLEEITCKKIYDKQDNIIK